MTPSYHSPLRHLLVSLLCQGAGFAVAIGLTQRIPTAPPLIPLLAHSSFSALLAWFCACSRPWIGFNALVPPLLILVAHLTIPSWVAMGLACGLALTYAPTLWTGVPLYTTSTRMSGEIAAELPNDRDFTFVDLGCGTGTLLMQLATLRPLGRFEGYEISIIPFCLAWIRAKCTSHGRVTIHFGDFWKLPLSQYDFVYAFLAPPPMRRLWEKARAEMRDGTVFLTNSFSIGEIPSRIRKAHDTRDCVLHIHEITRG